MDNAVDNNKSKLNKDAKPLQKAQEYNNKPLSMYFTITN